MPDSFGARLRLRREEKQIDLIAIAEQTKIKLALLEGLERDDVSAWPNGIFRRAYIRTYAQFIGLDPDVVLKEFLEAYPDQGDAFVTTAKEAAAAEEEFAKTAKGMRLRTIVDSALASLATKLRRPPMVDEAFHAPLPPRMTAPTEQFLAHAAHGPDVTDTEREPELQLDDQLDRKIDQRLDQPVDEQLGELLDHQFDQEPVAPAVQLTAEFETAELVDASAPQEVEETDAASVATAPPPTAAEVRVLAPEPELTDQATANAIAGRLQATHDARLENIAQLCTELGCVVERNHVQQLLQETAAALSASGLIIWLWDDSVEALRPALVHGYSEKVLAHVPAVKADSDNATAAAFRTMTTCEVAASSQSSGALVVPMLIPEGCTGVLALELQPGVQPIPSLRAMATLLAAALTQLVHRSRPAERSAAGDQVPPAVPQFRSAPSRPVKVRR